VEQMMISADDHIDLGFLPKDLWTERLPQSLRERAPHVEDRGDEGEQWVCDGEPWGEWRGGRWPSRPGRPVHALDRGGVNRDNTLRPTTTELRLADMQRDGVEASVLFPPILGLTSSDPALMVACIQAYNDWASDFGKSAPGRLLPVAQLFPDNMNASRDEVLRTAKLGVQQVCFLVGTVTPQMYTEEWEPFWAAAEDSGTIVSYHAGGGERPHEDWARVLGKPVFQMGIGGAGIPFFQPFVNLFTCRVLERHPKLRFVLGESGTGWVPYVVQQMDHFYLRTVEFLHGQHPLSMMPSEIFRRQVWATYQEDVVGLHLVPFFGEGHIMWASDYPHPDSTWPHSQEIVDKETAHLSSDARRQIVHDNAAALYGLKAA
jgi:uncharacterized protein